MIVTTETDISRQEQAMSYFPRSKIYTEFSIMKGWLIKDGHRIKELYRYESTERYCTIIGVVSEWSGNIIE